jgi:hypothetical protein
VIICLVSLVVGALMALCMPVGRFIAGLIVVSFVVMIVSLTDGASIGRVLIWAVLIYGGAQIGYGLGLVGLAWRASEMTGRRRATEERRRSESAGFGGMPNALQQRRKTH